MTRIALFLDGTKNTSSSETNIYRLYQNTKTEGQIKAYFPGVGTSNFFTSFYHAIFACGIKDIIHRAYDFLSEKYDPGDTIYLFGFSRGAFEVRALVGFLNTCGLRKNNEVSTKRLWKYFESTHRNETLEPLDVLAKQPKEILKGIQRDIVENCLQVKIQFVGIFDAVSADSKANNYMFGQNQEMIERIVHAMALDEQRGFFPVLAFKYPRPVRLGINPTSRELIEQRWFVGVHSHVGGGFSKDDVLSRIPLQWMQQEATKAGLKQDVIQLTGDEHQLGASQMNLDMYQRVLRWFKFDEREIGRSVIMNETIDRTVFERYQNDVMNYNPKNLEGFAKRCGLCLNEIQPATRYTNGENY
ncbi:hypothetical protein THRCLA_09931 [Thraustotheca clavata]|uniref:T6SS Phospholipase effector Tle1-like catalytic domain-containing protein n=1 Tax=Thraustotheca clavata TaxID=74557 RepID=A0A1V9YTL4_9STRA|nr:hypothetical protein THRCLA_09931 [Thraustotheca clavata]